MSLRVPLNQACCVNVFLTTCRGQPNLTRIWKRMSQAQTHIVEVKDGFCHLEADHRLGKKAFQLEASCFCFLFLIFIFIRI